MKNTKWAAALLGLILVYYPLYPQTAQEFRFSGRWVLNREKTGIAGLPDIAIEISRAEGVIHYRKTVRDSQNEWLTQMALAADGQEGGYTDSQGNRLKCSAALHDGDLTLVYQSRQMRSGKWVILDMEDEHSVSPDGKTMSIAHAERWEGNGGKWPRPMVFDRQAEDAGKGLFSKPQLIEDSRQLLSYLENVHPDPYRYSGGKVAFHRRFQDVLQSIPPQGMAMNDYFLLLSPFIAAIGDGHTVLLMSYGLDRQASGGLPLSFASIEKFIYVDGVPSEKDRALLGAKLLAVEGVPLAEMLKRISGLRAVENGSHGLMLLNVYLGTRPLLKELLPEWGDPSVIHVQLERADGRKQDLGFALRDNAAAPLVRAGSKLEVPSTERSEFAYRFLSPDRKTALLRVVQMTAYREGFESEGQSRDVSRQAAKAYESFHGGKAPADPAAVLAGIPSAVETFRQLVMDMKGSGTETLIVDLTQNGGGFSLMAEILTYFLYGKQKLAAIVTAERSVRKYSPFYFQALPERSLDNLNRQYAEIQSYPLTENDYDFGEDRYIELFRAGKIDLQTGLALKYAGSPTFLAELQSGAYSGYFTPKNVIVTTSNETYSSGFTMLRYLYQSGATVVGSASGQSGNGFGSSGIFALKNTGLRVAISKSAYVVFPEAPNERKQIIPHHELTYERLKGYGFDPHAAILYALDLLKKKRRGQTYLLL